MAEMTLRIFEASLENVKPALRGEYEKQSDGRYKLMLEDSGDLEDVQGLKSALKRERELNREYKAAGVTPDGLAAIGVMSTAVQVRAAPDVRAGFLPRRTK